MSQITRYTPDTPAWVVKVDHYRTIANDAMRDNKRIKAWFYNRLADRAFVKAGGAIYVI